MSEKDGKKMKSLEKLVEGKRVLFITTHRIDYIRNTQEIEILNKHAASVKLLYSNADNHIISAAKIFFTMLFSGLKDVDIVMVSYMCQLVIPFLNFKFRKKTLIVDFFVSLYDSMVNDRKLVKPGSLPARFIYKLDRDSLKYAKKVIADTRAHADYFAEEFHVDPVRMEILYLNADTSIYYPRQMEKEALFQGKFLVVYFGTVIPLQGMDIVLEAIDRLKDHKEIHFIMVGPVEKLYKKVDSDTVTYEDWVQQQRLAEYIAQADLCLAGHFNNTIMKAKRTIPGKAYIYEAMEKPMILGDSPANHERYREDQPGIWFVPMGDSKALADKILELSRDL